MPRGTCILQFGSDSAGIVCFTYFPGAIPEILLINPKDRLALLEIDEMCSDHFNLLLTVISRYDAESAVLVQVWTHRKSMSIEEVFAYLKCR